MADEPTSNLNKDNENDIINALKNLAYKYNKCVIVVLHSNNVKEEVDKINKLVNGTIKEK